MTIIEFTKMHGLSNDFVVLDRDPLEDIRNTRSISGVWIAGNAVKRPPTSGQ